MKKFTAILFRLPLLLCIFFADNNAVTASEKQCGNADCSVPISQAKTLVQYISPKENHVSFEKGLNVEVYSKHQKVWGIKVRNKIGLAPSTFLRENRVFIASRDLLNITYDIQPDPVKVETTQHESNDLSAEKTKEIPSGINSLLTFPSMAAAENVAGQEIVTPSSPQYEVIDGTTVFIDPMPEPQSDKTLPSDSVSEKPADISPSDGVPETPAKFSAEEKPADEGSPEKDKSETVGEVKELSSPEPTISVGDETNTPTQFDNFVTPSSIDTILENPHQEPDVMIEAPSQSSPDITMDTSTEVFQKTTISPSSEVETESTSISEASSTTETPTEQPVIGSESPEIQPTQSGMLTNLWNTMFTSGNETEEDSEVKDGEEEDGEDDDGDEEDEEEDEASVEEASETSSNVSAVPNIAASGDHVPHSASPDLNSSPIEKIPHTSSANSEDLVSSFPQTPGDQLSQEDQLQDKSRIPRQTNVKTEEVASEEINGAGVEKTSQEVLDQATQPEAPSEKLQLEEERQKIDMKEQKDQEQLNYLQEEKANHEVDEQLNRFQEEEKKLLEEEPKLPQEAEQQRLQEEQQRLQEEQQQRLHEEQQQRLHEEQQQRLHEEQQQRLHEEQQQRLEEEEKQRLVEEEKQRLVEEEKQRLEEEEKQRLEEEEKQRLGEEEKQRLEEEEKQRLEEDQRLLQEEEKKRQEEEELRREEERMRMLEKEQLEIEARKREEENRKALEEEHLLWRQNEEKQRLREEEMKRQREEAKRLQEEAKLQQEALEKEKESGKIFETTEEKETVIPEQEMENTDGESASGSVLSWISSLFRGGSESETPEVELSTSGDKSVLEPGAQIVPPMPPSEAETSSFHQKHEHSPIWSSAQQTMCGVSEAGCQISKADEESGSILMGILTPSLDVVLLRLAATAVALLMGALSFYFLRKKHVDSSLVARINELEKQLLIASKEAILLREEASNADINSIADQLNALQEELESARLIRADLEEQVSTLERELEEATETGIELNKLLTETLEANKGKAHAGLAASVERLQQQLDSQRDKVDSLTRSLKSTSAENENLKSSLAEGKERISALEAELAAAAEIANNMRRDKEEAGVVAAQNLQEVQMRLEEALSSKVLEESRLGSELSAMKLKNETLRSSLSMKESEIKALQDMLRGFESGIVKGEDLLDISKLKAELEYLKSDRDAYLEKYVEQERAKKDLENCLSKNAELVRKLEEKADTAEKGKEEAETRLAVLSNYFKEKEEQLQKELGVKEAIVAQHRGDESHVIKQLQLLQEEVNNYRAQNESLRQEILDQERDFKGQIATLEKKAHDNWVTARQAERRLEDARQEASQLRNRLTLIEKSHADPSARLDANGEGGIASPVMMMPLPPLGDLETPPPLPPFMFSPPPYPPPFMPPPLPPHPLGPMGRPPPLGRMSSPPPPLGQFSPPPPPYDRMDRSSRSPSPPPHRYHHRSPPPPQWDSPPSGFRPVPKPSPKKLNEQRDHKGSGHHSSGHSNDSMDKAREQV